MEPGGDAVSQLHMNRSLSHWLVLVLLALVLALAGGCSTSPMSRIDANRALYESWPMDVQSAVLEGKAIKDMTPEMVRMALGEPTRIEPRIGSTTGEETWIYEKSSGGQKLGLPNISLGGGLGGLGVSTGGRRGGRGGGGGAPAAGNREQQEVVFQNGVVTRVN
jgi:hypothetical protein